MTQTIRVSIGWRGTILASGAVLKDVDQDGGFLQGEAPLPVWTSLTLSPDDDPEIAVEARVTHIVEACRARALQSPGMPGMAVGFLSDAGALLRFRCEEPGPPEPVVEPSLEIELVAAEATEDERAHLQARQSSSEPEEDEPIQLRAGVVLMGSEARDRQAEGSVKVIVEMEDLAEPADLAPGPVAAAGVITTEDAGHAAEEGLEAAEEGLEAAEEGLEAAEEGLEAAEEELEAAEEELEAAEEELDAAGVSEEKDEEGAEAEGGEGEEGADDPKKKRRGRVRRKKKRK